MVLHVRDSKFEPWELPMLILCPTGNGPAWEIYGRATEPMSVATLREAVGMVRLRSWPHGAGHCTTTFGRERNFLSLNAMFTFTEHEFQIELKPITTYPFTPFPVHTELIYLIKFDPQMEFFTSFQARNKRLSNQWLLSCSFPTGSRWASSGSFSCSEVYDRGWRHRREWPGAEEWLCGTCGTGRDNAW